MSPENMVKQKVTYLFLPNQLASFNQTIASKNLLKKWFSDLGMNVPNIPTMKPQ